MLRRSANEVLLYFAADTVVTLAAVWCAIWLRLNTGLGRDLPAEHGMGVLYFQATALYMALFVLFSVYDPERIYRAVDEYYTLTVASAVAGLALAGLVYFTARDVSRLSVLYFFGCHFVLLMGWRTLARVARQGSFRPRTHHRVLLVGSGEPARRALDRLFGFAWAGVDVIGYVREGAEEIPGAPVPCVGTVAELEPVLDRHDVDDVLLAVPAERQAEFEIIMSRLAARACNVWMVPDYYSILLYGARVADLSGIPMISLKATTLSGYQRLIKRAFDLLVTAVLLLVTLPLLVLVALAIKLTSRGPVLFSQERVGENGRLFRMHKFRSMHVDAEERLHEVIRYDEEGNLVHKRGDDPRVTPVGRLLRRTSLDELPQLFNVLKGEMSLVGPRPELPFLVEKYEVWQRTRLAVPQGITGWWQVNGRSDKPMHLNSNFDLHYVQNYSLLLDLQILLKTAVVVLRGRGAY